MEDYWIKVFTAYSEHEAHIVKGLLESQGITCKIKSMAVPQYPFTVDGLAEREIYVLEEQYEESVWLLEENLERGEGE